MKPPGLFAYILLRQLTCLNLSISQDFPSGRNSLNHWPGQLNHRGGKIVRLPLAGGSMYVTVQRKSGLAK